MRKRQIEVLNKNNLFKIRLSHWTARTNDLKSIWLHSCKGLISLNNLFYEEEMQRIKGTQIKNLITKFYYKDNHLCFQILIHGEADQTINYREFTDYDEYKQEYNILLKAKSENSVITIPDYKQKETQMNFA